MATLYIREYAQLGVVPAKFGAFTAVQAGQESDAITDQTVAIATGTSSISAAFQCLYGHGKAPLRYHLFGIFLWNLHRYCHDNQCQTCGQSDRILRGNPRELCRGSWEHVSGLHNLSFRRL